MRILKLDASMRGEGSYSRKLTGHLVKTLQDKNGKVEVRTRDLRGPIPFVNEQWIGANFTDKAERSAEQKEILAVSDALVEELRWADTIVIGLPIYNFGPPAAFKAWIDMVARARETFRYSENGPVGLLEGKKAYVIVASGGTGMDSEIDFATPFVRHVLGFIGIHDVKFIEADKIMVLGEGRIEETRQKIANMVEHASAA